jgi:hypothetical protein
VREVLDRCGDGVHISIQPSGPSFFGQGIVELIRIVAATVFDPDFLLVAVDND